MANIRKNDQVEVLLGKDKGKKGKVERVIAKEGKLIIAGVNIYKRHKKDQTGSAIIDVVKPLHISQVGLICPKCNQITRVGTQVLSNGDKSRICKKCGEVV